MGNRKSHPSYEKVHTISLVRSFGVNQARQNMVPEILRCDFDRAQKGQTHNTVGFLAHFTQLSSFHHWRVAPSSPQKLPFSH